MNANHKAESQALLLTARAEPTEQESEQLRRLMGNSFDWDYFYRLARKHSLVPVVYCRLQNSIKDTIPSDALKRFRRDYQENAARNTVFADELISLIKTFANDGIEAIAFKGPALAIAAYGDLKLRRFIDLDLIVRRSDMSRAIRILQQRDYIPAKSLDDQQQSLLLHTQHNLQFTRRRMIVELHWQVSSELFASSLTAEELWQRLDTVNIEGTSVRTLAPEDLLFALSVHGSRHIWQKLAWICDIDRLIRARPELDWQALIIRAKKAAAQRMFLLAVSLSQQLLGTEVPQFVREAISQDARIGGLVEEISRRLFDGPEPREQRFSTMFRFNFLIRTEWRTRIRYCRFLLAPTDSDLAMLRLSKPLHFVYYVLRPLRLLWNSIHHVDPSPPQQASAN